MKYRKFLLSAIGLCAMGMNAQTVTVILNDGTKQQWPASDVKEISFADEIEQEVTFTSVKIDPYAPAIGGVEINLYNDSDKDGKYVAVKLDTTGIPGAETLSTGVYTVGAQDGLKINNADAGYCHVSVDGLRCPIVSGTATISNDGSIYTIEVDLVYDTDTEEGEKTLKGKYVGKINAMSVADMETTFVSVNIDPYSIATGGVEINLYNDAESEEGYVAVKLDTTGTPGSETLSTGVYTVGAQEGLKINNADAGYCHVSVDGMRCPIVSGTATISNEGVIYTIDVDLVYETEEGNKTIKGQYVGTINAMSVPMELSQMSYYELDNMEPGQQYIKFNDNDWNVEGAIDFRCGADATELLPGTYTYSESGDDFTFTNKSYVDYYRPSWVSLHTSGGTIVVEKDGDDYKISMDLKMDDGRNAKFEYNGLIISKKK